MKIHATTVNPASMPRYVALLRAINVGGRTVKMDALRREFEAMGLHDVSTFIASGNVLFSARGQPASLERRIAQGLQDALGFEVGTFVRAAAQMAEAATRQPFGALAAGESMHVGFLECPLDAAGRRTLTGFTTATDAFAAVGGEVYWKFTGRSSDSDFNLKKFEKALGQTATFRNMSTVQKLAALLTS